MPSMSFGPSPASCIAFSAASACRPICDSSGMRPSSVVSAAPTMAIDFGFMALVLHSGEQNRAGEAGPPHPPIADATGPYLSPQAGRGNAAARPELPRPACGESAGARGTARPARHHRAVLWFSAFRRAEQGQGDLVVDL